MDRLFGTDGIRGRAFEHPLDEDTVRRLGAALAEILDGAGEPHVLLAGDTRASTNVLAEWFAGSFRNGGGRITWGGVLPTPAVSHLLREGSYGAGVVISASHNPAEDNGIKILGPAGEKLADESELRLEARIASMNMENRIHEVVIPTREVPEFKNGKKVMTEKKLFPGYLLCRTVLDDDAWYVIRNTPGVTGFVNQGGKPSPMRRKDVENFLGVEADRKQEQSKKSKPMFEYSMGETVRVKEGPFADFSGEIIEINEDQLKVKVLVNIFGRETPVELEFAQVARL